MRNDVQGFLSSLPRWSNFFESFRLPNAVAGDESLDELRQRLANVRRRLRDGPDAPLRIAFFGPTGAGKSKLFGSLIEDNFSGSGFKRPFTRRSFYYLHEDWKPLVAALVGEVSMHQDDEWRDVMLVDTPDFDSVEAENREEAERVFLESDGFLFVTDALKYADASTWEYLQRIYEGGKAFAVVLNKVNSSNVEQSFRERFQLTLTKGKPASYTQVVVPELRIDDATLIDSEHPSMCELRATAQRLVRGDRTPKQVSVDMLRNECESFCGYSDDLRMRITSKRTQVDDAIQALHQRADIAKRRLDARLDSGLEPAVRDDVYRDVLKRLEHIDVLSYPRKILAMPVKGLKALLTTWLPNPDPPAEHQDPAFADPISSETFHLLESEMIAFADQSRNDIVARADLSGLIDRETFKRLRYSHADMQQMYVEHHEEFAKWVANHAEQTASQITGENKAKFVLSQVLFNTVLLSSQVAWGGFSPLDLAADGVISPMVAKGVSMAIGSEKVKDFEEAAHREHQRSLCELFDRGVQRFESFLEQSCVGLDDLEQHLNEISASRSLIPEILRHFDGAEGATRSTDSVTTVRDHHEDEP